MQRILEVANFSQHIRMPVMRYLFIFVSLEQNIPNNTLQDGFQHFWGELAGVQDFQHLVCPPFYSSIAQLFLIRRLPTNPILAILLCKLSFSFHRGPIVLISGFYCLPTSFNCFIFFHQIHKTPFCKLLIFKY